MSAAIYGCGCEVLGGIDVLGVIRAIGCSQCNIFIMNNLSNSLHLSDSAVNRQLFLPEELESIKLTQLRSKRRNLEEKVRLVSNRIKFRHNKEENELKRYIRSEERSRVTSESKNYKKIQEIMKQELDQKREFEGRKKAREVEQFRQTQSQRRELIHQALKDRKHLESEQVRRTKKREEQQFSSAKQNYDLQVRQKYEMAIRTKERQQAKKKYYWLVQKRLTFQQGMLEQTQIYEKQVHDFHRKIQLLRDQEDQLKIKQEHATEVLRCAEQNYQLLKKA